MDPSHIFGTCFLFISAAVSFIVSGFFYQRFLENKSRKMLYIVIDFIFVGFGSSSLALEKILLICFPDGMLGIISGYFALYFSALAILAQGMYVADVVFPKEAYKIYIFFSSLIIFYLALALIQPPSIIPSLYEIEFPIYLSTATLFTTVLILIVNSMMLFYYSGKVRKHSPPHSIRSTWLAIANFIILIAYIPEITLPGALSNYFRFIFILNPIAWYIAVIKFSELEWPKKIRHIYIIHGESGLCIYDHRFSGEMGEESNLISSSLMGIAKIIPEITRSSQKLNYLDQGDVKILMEHGSHVICALITEANFGILRTKLRNFIQEFENFYKKNLLNFAGSLTEFKNSKEIIDRVFSHKYLLDGE